MTLALSLKNTKILTLTLLAIIFSFVYLIFVAHTFAQTSPSADQMVKREAQKLKVCQIHERNIKNKLDSLIRLVTNQETKFSAIVTRVENRYAQKLVPQGKTVGNYDALVADIATKKSSVDAALSTAKSDVASFSCTASDPKAQLIQYRKNMQAVKSALKDYRKSIKNLIVAVATASGEKLKPEAIKNEE